MAELLDNLISLSSLEGAVLARAQPAAAPMWSLLAHFETQHTQSFCSIATAAMLLNVLGVPKPIDPVYAPYPYFTQANVLGECALAKPVTTNKNRAGGEHISVAFIGTHGATLAEWRDYVACWADTAVVYAAESSLEAFRARARTALEARPPRGVGLNLARRELGEEGGGHMSPLAAYDKPTDRFLLLDVARYKYPGAWVRAAQLFAAMNSTDTTAGRSRGWIELVPPAGADPEPGTVAGPRLPQHEWSAVKSCVTALAPTDALGVMACMADPSRRLLRASSSSSGVEVSLVLVLCALCVVLGATLALTTRRCAKTCAARKRWGLKLEDAAAQPAPPTSHEAGL